MSRRTRNIIIAVILLALILLALWLLFGRREAGVPFLPAGETPDISKSLGGGQLDTTYGGNVNRGRPVEQPPAAEEEEEEPVQIDTRSHLTRLAAAFAERYGSFSNTSNFENLSDLTVFMSVSMTARTEQYVENARAEGSTSAEYFGITTRALSTEVTALDETAGSAKVMVQTQRQAVSGSTGESVYYQEIMIEFVQEGGVWKVDAIEWQPRE